MSADKSIFFHSIHMNITFLQLLLLLSYNPGSHSQPLYFPVAIIQMDDKFVDGLLQVDVQRLKLTPEQTVKARKVLTGYREKYNALMSSHPSADIYKSKLVAIDIERIHEYKAFLTADQYKILVAGYNKYHPKSPIE